MTKHILDWIDFSGEPLKKTDIDIIFIITDFSEVPRSSAHSSPLTLPLPLFPPSFLFLPSSPQLAILSTASQWATRWLACGCYEAPAAHPHSPLSFHAALLDHPSLSLYLIPQLVSVARLTAPQDKCCASFSSTPQTEGYAMRAHMHTGDQRTHTSIPNAKSELRGEEGKSSLLL